MHFNTHSRQPSQASTSGCLHDLHETRRLSGQAPRVPRRSASRAGRRKQKQAQLVRAVAEAVERRPTVALQAQNEWVEKILQTLDRQSTPSRLAKLREECQRTLESQRMPTIRNEEYRFTDVSLLLKTAAQEAKGKLDEDKLHNHRLSENSDAVRLVIVNGAISEHSSIGELPQGVYIGGIGNAPDEAAEHLGRESLHSGGPFAVLNGALTEEVICIYVPTAVELERPIHIIYATSGSDSEEKVSVSSPRLMVMLRERASCQIVEEFVAAGETGRYFNNAVAEIVLEEGASLKHGYVELENKQSWHMKASIVHQAESSRYNVTETQLGGMMTRHDLTINQAGSDTETVMRAFLLCGPSQLHDLHSKLRLDHPRGVANQLHKCIVSASSGRGVFDGNVHVKQKAQQTDAAQLSRNLLLSPKAMVNVKPNLQIVADDVKCSHGCAVSDLQEDQLFYFRTRGIDYATARQVLVYSFGNEVTQHFKHPLLIKRIQENVNATLRLASLS